MLVEANFAMSPPLKPVLLYQSHSELGGRGVGAGVGGVGMSSQTDSSERDLATEAYQMEKLARMASSTSGYFSLRSFLSPKSALRS